MLTHLHLGGFAATYLVSMAPRKDAAAAELDRFGQPGQVLEWMELALIGKTQTGAKVNGQRNSSELHDVCQPGAMGRGQFAVEDISGFSGCEKKIAIQPREVAIDFLGLHDRFNPIDG